MDPLEKITQIKKRITDIQREADKAQGSLDVTLEQLQEKFDCSTLEQGHKLLRKLRSREKKAQEKLWDAFHTFEEKYDTT